MATCRDIITRALRMGRVTRSPTAREADEGLGALQGVYDAWFTSGMFGRLSDVDATGAYTAKEGERVTGASSITKPTQLDDGCSPTGTRRPYEMSAIVDATNAVNWLWIDGEWVNCTGLTLDSDAPLSSKGAEGLAALISYHIAEDFGGSLGPARTQQAMRFQGSISHKFGSTQPEPVGEYF